MIKKPLANLGVIFSLIFLAGLILNLVTGSMRGVSFITTLSHPTNIAQLLLSILFLVSAWTPRLYWIQPTVFLVITPLPFIESHVAFYGMAFFVLAVLLLFKIGFFNARKIEKFIGLLFYLFITEVVIAILVGRPLRLAFTTVFFVTAFLVILYILYHEEIIIYLKEPKPVLDLKEKKLSAAEYLYLINLHNGKNQKEIAFDHGVTESTIRNTLARVYRKLGVKDKSELLALTAVHTLKYGELEN